MYCRECGAEIPEGLHRCPSCGTWIDGGRSEVVAMILSLILPGMGLVYLGDRDRGLKVFIPSVILLALVVVLYGYSEPGSMGVRVDSLPGFLMVFAMFVLWLYGNIAARRLWKEQVGLRRRVRHTFISDSRIRANYRDIGRVRNMRSFKTNPQLIALIDNLKAKTRETEAAIWRDVALRLEKPKRNWAEANLSKLERYAQDGETILVPGKVLAAGTISKKITVAAYDFSDAAAKAIEAAGGKTLTIEELAEANPKGTGVRIMR